MFHILNGDAVVSAFKKAGFTDDYAVWRELHCQGPTSEIIDSSIFAGLRMNFLKNYLDISYYFYDDHTEAQLQRIKRSSDKDITLWFEYDLFCQINMMVAINFLLQTKPASNLYLVLVGQSLTHSDWVTLGQLTSKEWREAFTSRKIIDQEAATFIKQAWSIYCSRDHGQFESIMPTCPTIFKYLPQAVENHYRRFPSRKDGLTDIQRYVFQNLNSHNFTRERNFIGLLLKDFHFYGYGDLQYKAILSSLAHFIDYNPDKGYRLKKEFSGHLALQDYQYLPEMTYGGQSNKDLFLEDFIEI